MREMVLDGYWKFVTLINEQRRETVYQQGSHTPIYILFVPKAPTKPDQIFYLESLLIYPR